MSFKRINLLVLLSICATEYTHAQQDSRIPKVISPAPHAAAIQRFGDVPVGPYSGQPNISIPLYDVESGNFSTPISISYNASGIKVADEASRVGLGWVLEAGGVISRSIIGADDWDTYFPNRVNISMGHRSHQGASFNFKYQCPLVMNGDTIPSSLINSTNNDFQPDQYSYNFNGHSGKFVLRSDKTVVLNKIEKIQISLTDTANGSSWEIKAPDGIRYIFEDVESYVENATNHKSSWYLSKIILPSGRAIEFQYTTITSNLQPAGSYFESRIDGYVTSGSSGCPPSIPSNYSNIVAGKTYQSLYLSKIISDQCETRLIYSSGRVDISNEVQLDSVKIYAKKYGESNTFIKAWCFTYSYFKGTDLNGWFNPTDTNQLYKRLKLLSVKECSSSTCLPPYLFSYNNDDNVSGALLPAKLSFARDHWGYFNGKFSNTSLIPTYYGGGGGGIAPGAMGGERSTDPNFSQLFILKSIQYPTGGFTKFEYESNIFDEPNSIVNDHSFFANYTAAIPTSVQAGFSNIQAGGTFSGTLNVKDMYPFAQYATLNAYFIKTSGLDVSTINQITYSLKDSAGTEIGGGYVGSYLGNSTPPNTEYLGTQQSNSGVMMTLIKALTPQVYTWSFTVPAGLTAANAVVYYTKGEGFNPIVVNGDTIFNALFGGGLRIKRIYDSVDYSSPVKIRKYNYHYQSVAGKKFSYGRRMAKPNYSYYQVVAGGSSCSGDCLTRESDSNIPLNGGSNGVAVGYDKVEELFGDNGENGKILYEYRNQPDMIWDYRDYSPGWGGSVPRKPPYGGVMSDAGNGNLLKQTTYAKVNGEFVITHEVTNTYLDVSNYNNSIVYGIEQRLTGSTGTCPGYAGYFYFTYPALARYRYVLSASENKDYGTLGTLNPINNTTEYTYDTLSHLQLTSQSTYKSTGEKVTAYYKYAADYNDAQCDSAIKFMKGNGFMHALPVSIESIITRGTDKLLTAANINKYMRLGNKIVLKESVFLETNSPINVNTPPTPYNPSSTSYPSGYTVGIFYDKHDSIGNYVEGHKLNDHPVSYIWDYFQSYPVAEVINADSASIAYTSFEADAKGNWTFSGSSNFHPTAPTGLRGYSLVGGNISKSGLVTTGVYIVTYWKRDSASTVTVNSATGTPTLSRNGWVLYTHEITEASTLTIAGTAYIDELRLYPKQAMMTTRTYAPLLGVTSECGSNNSIVYYEYDDFGRLKLIRDQDRKIIKRIDYKYQATYQQ